MAGGIPAREDSVRALEIIARALLREGDEPSLRGPTINIFEDKIWLEKGDFTIGSGSSGRRSDADRDADAITALDDGYLERHIRAYVRPPGFRGALDILGGRHLLILRGGRGSGRQAAALKLLATVSARGQLNLVRSSALVAGGWSCGPHGTGFLSSFLEADLPARIDDVWLQRTAKRLVDAGNFMVIVAGKAHEGLAGADSGTGFVFEELGLPNPMAVLRARIRAAVDPGLDAGLRVVAGQGRHHDIAYRGSQPALCSTGRRGGGRRAQRRKGPRGGSARVSGPGGPGPEAWFARFDPAAEADCQQMVLPVAVSVPEDSSYLTVSDAATDLFLRLFPQPKKSPGLSFRRTLTRHHTWIELTMPPEPATIYGDPSPEVVRFRSPQMRRAVLQHVWTWQDGMRPALSEWLADLGRHADVEVRARAATSADRWPHSTSPTCCIALSIPGQSR